MPTAPAAPVPIVFVKSPPPEAVVPSVPSGFVAANRSNYVALLPRKAELPDEFA